MGNARKPMTRSEIMSRVKGKNTLPEMMVRRGLHERGFRYRLHRRDLPGTPDLTLAKFSAVIEVRGCYWHGHLGCGRVPKTNVEFWETKFKRNRVRDEKNIAALRIKGWRVLVIWECALVGRRRLEKEELLNAIVSWIASDQPQLELGGANPDDRQCLHTKATATSVSPVS